ncbi:MAG: Holliday junction branch migration DNA helicase RuvB [Spirochaetaceae bacterium]|jgi:Holliday junction DNA helicase RuvB|nr:Holliday junction branch migration DNA helicase RuvB [Spirochaetaceae bacterium]
MDDQSFLTGDPIEQDSQQENIIRPKVLKDFQGQPELKENLAIFIQAAREREEALDHVFISGPPGLGKTTLAGIMSNELAVDFKVTSAPALDKPKDLAGLLTTLTERSVFFIDEIHRLKPVIEEMLYIAMEDYELDWIIGQGPSARTVRIPVPPFTLIGATTKPGRVARPLFTRFGINIRIHFYKEEELALIIRRTSKLLDIHIDDDASLLLAKCSRGTPRVANRLLKRIRDYAQVANKQIIQSDDVLDGLQRLGVDHRGLEEMDRMILKSIIEKFSGGPVGAETLAISVGEGIDALEDFYEPYLIQQGFLKRTPRGRMVTPLGYQHLGLDIDEDQRLLF